MAMRRPGFRILAPARPPLPQQQQQRARRGLNENYARELMELHTLGVDGGYTQKDVQEVARALTGWTFNRQSGEFQFNPIIHDAGEKTILGQKFPAGRGEDEGERVLDLVASHPSTAHFIVTKLARHFVSDDPPKALVDRCASTFSKTQGDIRETLRCVVTSPEFFSRAAYRAKVKTPFEVVASALRAVNATPGSHAAHGAARRATRPADLRPADARWMAGSRRRVDEHGRDPEPDQLRPELGGRSDPRRAAHELDRLRVAAHAASHPTGGRGREVDARRTGVSRDAAGAHERREPDVGGGDASDANGMADSSAMGFGRARGGGRGAQQQAKPDGKGFPRGPGAQIPGFGRPVNLQGLPQVVGLALGAPEFQRR